MKKPTTRVTIVVCCLVVLILGYYTYLSNRTRGANREAYMTAVESVLSRDLENDYPPTPKEVIKYYNEIMKCFYNEECTEEEIEQLAVTARTLYDEELLAENEWEPYLTRLTAEIQDYKEKKRKITSFAVAASTDVDYYPEETPSFARIRCSYNVMESGTNRPVNEVYLLRRDEEKHWKIYGWTLAENLDVNQDE